jgi:hypothetical protein
MLAGGLPEFVSYHCATQQGYFIPLQHPRLKNAILGKLKKKKKKKKQAAIKMLLFRESAFPY